MAKKKYTLETLTAGAKTLKIKVTKKMGEDEIKEAIDKALENEDLEYECPNCGLDIPDVEACPYCGQTFGEDDEEETDDEESDDEEENNDEESGDDEETALEDLSDEELIAKAEELEIEVSYKGKGKAKKLDRDALIEAINEASEESSDEETEEENNDEDNSEEETALEDLSDDELIEKGKGLDIDPTYKGKGKAKKLDRDALIEAINEASEESGEDEEDTDVVTGEKALEDCTDEELESRAGELHISLIYKGKGKAKKLDRDALIEAINEKLSENEEEETALEDLSDEDLIAKAEEVEVDPVYKGKGKNKKLDREATIEAINEAGEEDSDDEEEVKEEVKVEPKKEEKKSGKKVEPAKEDKKPEKETKRKQAPTSPHFSKEAVDPIKKACEDLGLECIEKTSLNTFKKNGKRVFSQYKVPKTITLWIVSGEAMKDMDGLKKLTKEEADELHVGTSRAIWEGTDVKKAIAVITEAVKAFDKENKASGKDTKPAKEEKKVETKKVEDKKGAKKTEPVKEKKKVDAKKSGKKTEPVKEEKKVAGKGKKK